MKHFILLLIFIFGIQVFAAHEYPERYYQNKWCSKWHGEQEYKLNDNTRVDCITTNYAVEFDFAPKWAESVGQSLHYAEKTGKKPAIILIIEKESDWKHYRKVKPLCKKYNIQLWYMVKPNYRKY